MAHGDLAGSLPAARRANGHVAKIAINLFKFKQPVFIGDMFSICADIVIIGNTSITANVEEWAERNQPRE